MSSMSHLRSPPGLKVCLDMYRWVLFVAPVGTDRFAATTETSRSEGRAKLSTTQKPVPAKITLHA